LSLWKRALLLPVAALSAMAWSQSRISAVEVAESDGGLDVAIVGSNLSKPRELRVLGGQSFIVEFDATLDMKGFRKRVSSSGVTSVEVGWYSARPPRARIHLRLDTALAPLVYQDGQKWMIRVRQDGRRLTPNATNPLPPAMGAGTALDGFPASVPPLNPLPKSEAAGLAKGTLKPEDSSPAPAAPAAPQAKAIQPTAAPAPKTLPSAAAQPARTAPPEKKVNLEFVGADVVQVLRALSKEAGVNIVTAPDVSPQDKPARITVSLKGVSISEALTYVTVIANLRYAKLNNTFFVTKSENFATTMREFYKGDASRFATRVASVPSGEGVQIRSAILAAYPQDGEGGFYDILDPDTTGFANPGAAAKAPAAGDQAGAPKPAPFPGLPVWMGGDPAGQAAAQAPQTRARISFLMLVGDPRKLDIIEAAVRELDSKISGSFSLSKTEDTGAESVPILSGQTKQIREMLEKLLESNPRKGAFTFSESNLRELSEGDMTTNVILMIGPRSDLALLKMYAQTLDENLCRTAGIAYSRDTMDLARVYEVVDLMYIEPVVAAFDLKNRIRGLYVTTLPDPVTPSASGQQKDEKRDATKAPTGDGAAPVGEAAKKDELEKPIGREPLKLVLRGTKQQIAEAKEYLSLVDVPPRQAAFEIRVLEMTKEEAQRLGIDWSLLTGGRLTRLNVFQGLGDAAGVPGTNSGSYRYKGSDAVSWLATLDKIDDGRRIISRPNALLSDGRPWSMFVGDTIRYIESIQSTQNGITISTASIDVGVTVDLKGRFGADGSIALEVGQIYNILNSFTAVPGGGQLPQTSERRVNTTVNMKAGEVLAFGGLIQEITRRNVSGIPILMDLPLIGQLFRRSVKEKDRTELVFILAAVDVTPANRSDAASPRRNETETPDPNRLYQNNEIRNGKP
jgi:type II secretory pathway component GspD/PulD (secretin)